MARYAAMTDSASVDQIDVVEVAGGIVASSVRQSTFMPLVSSQNGPRKRVYGKQGALAWGALSSFTSAPDETEYTPTGVTTTNTTHHVDVVLDQYALADARTQGKSLKDQILEEGAIGYAKYFDGLNAALRSEVSTTTPDHLIGTVNDALTGPLLDQALELLSIAGAPGPYAIVIYTGKLREFFQIPGMREASILGGNGGQGGISNLVGGSPNNKLVVSGYNGVADIYHSDQIVSASGRHNLAFSIGDGVSNTAFVNPWSQLENGSGLVPGKMMVDVHWNSAQRAVEINMTTMEDFSSRTSTTANDWLVDFVTT